MRPQDGTPQSLRNKQGTAPNRFNSKHESCVLVQDVLGRVGDKWTVLAIGMLGDGTKRFGELRRLIDGVSQRMLTLTLRHLERDGLVTRTVFPTVPPRVDYALTPLGRTLLPPVTELLMWVNKSSAQITRARREFDKRQAHGPQQPPAARRPSV